MKLPVAGLPVERVTEYEAELLGWLRAEHGGLLADIRNSKDLGDDAKAKLVSALDTFAKQFA